MVTRKSSEQAQESQNSAQANFNQNGHTDVNDEIQSQIQRYSSGTKQSEVSNKAKRTSILQQRSLSKASKSRSRGSFRVRVVEDQNDIIEKSIDKNSNIKNYLEDMDPKLVSKQLQQGNMYQKYIQRAENDEKENLEQIFESDDEGISRQGSDKLKWNNATSATTLGRQDSLESTFAKKPPIKKKPKLFNFLFLTLRILFVTLSIGLFLVGVFIKNRPQVFAKRGQIPCAKQADLWKVVCLVGLLGVNYLCALIFSKLLLTILKVWMPPRFFWYFAIPIRHQFRILVMAVLQWVAFGVLFNNFQDGQCLCQHNKNVNYTNGAFFKDANCTDNVNNYNSIMDTVSKLHLSLLLFGIANILKRLFTKLFAARDHGTRQFQRGLESLFAEFIIIVLYTPKGDQKLAQVDEMILKWHLPLIKALEDPSFSQSVQLRDALQKHIEMHSIKFFDDLTKKNRGQKQMKKEAQRITKRIYKNINANKPAQEQGYMVKTDFYDYFPEAFVNKAYQLFDKNDDGEVSKEECADVIQQIFQDRINLRRTLRDQNNIYGKLENIIGLVLFFLVAMTVLFIFNENIGNIWTVFTGSAAIFSLVLQDPIKRFVESTIFLFLIRPFDIGDWIIVGSDIFQVHKIHLMDMIFKRTDGSKFYYPNNLLYTSRIVNLTQSDGWIDTFQFVVDMNTPKNKLDELFDRCKTYIANNTHDHNDFFVTQIVPSDIPFKVEVQIICQYKTNMKDGLKVLPMKTRFFQYVMKQCTEVGIKFTLPKASPSAMGGLNSADMMNPQNNMYGGLMSNNQPSQATYQQQQLNSQS